MTSARCPHPRLPARPSRRGAGVRGDLRRVARGRRLHRRLRRGGHRGAVRGPHHPHVVPAALRPTSRTFRPLLPFYPHAVESFDLRGYDTVISSSSAWAHGVLVDPGAVHVCYCHNPFRYAWTEREATLRPAARSCARRCACCSRAGASGTGSPPSASTATSPTRAPRPSACAATSGRESTVLHPPVEIDRFVPGPVGAHYVVLAELMAHKRIDVAVEAFTRLGLPLVVIGDGPGGPAAAPARRADGHLHRAHPRRAGRRAPGRLARARGHRRRGVRHRGRRGARRRAAR